MHIVVRCFHSKFDNESSFWAVVVVKWSTCSPSSLTIRVRIPLTPTVLSVKFVREKNENKTKKRPEQAHFLEKVTFWAI